jgi:hypothetical protein
MIKLLVVTMAAVLLGGCVPGVILVLKNQSGHSVVVEWCEKSIEIQNLQSAEIHTCKGMISIKLQDGSSLAYKNLDPINTGISVLEQYFEYPTFFGKAKLTLQLDHNRSIYVLPSGRGQNSDYLQIQPTGFPLMGAQ